MILTVKISFEKFFGFVLKLNDWMVEVLELEYQVSSSIIHLMALEAVNKD